jgi:hypothetical protein
VKNIPLYKGLQGKIIFISIECENMNSVAQHNRACGFFWGWHRRNKERLQLYFVTLINNVSQVPSAKEQDFCDGEVFSLDSTF